MSVIEKIQALIHCFLWNSSSFTFGFSDVFIRLNIMILQHLFVYGTLRPNLASSEAQQLLAEIKIVGSATVQGTLYDFGAFPGVTKGDGIVHGDLLCLSHIEQLSPFDAYEECHGISPLFTRSSTKARLHNGVYMPAWIYLYSRDTKTGTQIMSGDYGQYIEERCKK